MSEEKEKTVKDIFRYSYSISQSQLAPAQSRYDYLLARRDQFNDKIRTGSLALNAASLVGVFTALSTDTIANGQFGLGVADLAFSACAFMVGLIGGVLGIAFESYRIPTEASRQFDHLSRQQNHRAALEVTLTEKSADAVQESMERLHALPPTDFGFSWASLLATNFSGGAWIAGILLPLWKVGQLINL